MDKKKLVKIGIPVLIVLLVAGVWFIKNQESVESVTADTQVEATAIIPAVSVAPQDSGTSGQAAADIQAEPTADTPDASADPKDQGTSVPPAADIQAAAAADSPSVSADPNFTLHTEKIDLQVLSAYNLPMILDFGSDDCIPCKEMAPVLKTMNAEMRGKAIIRFVDVWKYTNGADGFPVQVIPTQVLVTAEGKPYVPSEAMESSGIRFTMYTRKDTKEHVFTVHQGGLTEEQMRLILKDMGVV
ncbi:MAG: thioredoxin family protein [Christensenellales bacterium]